MDAASPLTLINERHGTAFALMGCYPHGEPGAFSVTDSTGERGVLKWYAGEPEMRLARLHETAAVTAHLRARLPDPMLPAERYDRDGRLLPSGDAARRGLVHHPRAAAAAPAATQRSATGTGRRCAGTRRLAGAGGRARPAWRTRLLPARTATRLLIRHG